MSPTFDQTISFHPPKMSAAADQEDTIAEACGADRFDALPDMMADTARRAATHLDALLAGAAGTAQ